MRGFPTAIPAPKRGSRGERSRYDVIVIGSGVGGAVAAGLLARHGRRLLVVEKNEALGGILASYEEAGFKIDRGSHLVSRGARGPLGRALREAGLERPRFLTHRIPVRSRGLFDIAAPARRSGLPRVAMIAMRRLGLGPADAAGLARLFARILGAGEATLAREDGRTLDELVRAYTEHPGAYYLLSFLASIFFILPPWRVSAGEAIRALRWILRDYSLSYVEGGMDAIAHALLSRVPEHGGEIVVGQRVVTIDCGSRLRVTTEAGDTYEADSVVANLPPPALLALLPTGTMPEAWAARARAMEASGNAHQLKLGLDTRLVEEGCLIGGLTRGGLTLSDLTLDLMQETVAGIEAGRVVDPLAVYAPVPTNYDPSLGPDGGQLVVASIYGPTTTEPADPPSRWKAAALEAFERVLPGLSSHLVFAHLSPVPAIGAWMGRASNGAVAAGQGPAQVGAARLGVATPLRGLYVCGDGAGGHGVGTELAATSGMIAARRILETRA